MVPRNTWVRGPEILTRSRESHELRATTGLVFPSRAALAPMRGAAARASRGVLEQPCAGEQLGRGEGRAAGCSLGVVELLQRLEGVRLRSWQPACCFTYLLTYLLTYLGTVVRLFTPPGRPTLLADANRGAHHNERGSCSSQALQGAILSAVRRGSRCGTILAARCSPQLCAPPALRHITCTQWLIALTHPGAQITKTRTGPVQRMA